MDAAPLMIRVPPDEQELYPKVKVGDGGSCGLQQLVALRMLAPGQVQVLQLGHLGVPVQAIWEGAAVEAQRLRRAGGQRPGCSICS